MLTLRETSVAEPLSRWPGHVASAAGTVTPPGVTATCTRRSRQDWLAEAMQCLCYENLSARSPE